MCLCPSFFIVHLLSTSLWFFFLCFHRKSAAWNWHGDWAVPPAHHGWQGEHALHQRGTEWGPADGQRRAAGGAQDVHQWHHPGWLPSAQSTWRWPALPPELGLHGPSPRSHLEGNQSAGSFGDTTVIQKIQALLKNAVGLLWISPPYRGELWDPTVLVIIFSFTRFIP